MDSPTSQLPDCSGARSAEPPRSDADSAFARHIHAFCQQAGQFKEIGTEKFTEAMSRWLSLHYMEAAHRASEEAGEEGLSLDTLHDLSAHMLALRAGDHSVKRLAIQREHNEIQRQLTKEQMERVFEQWLKRPEIMARYQKEKLSPEEKERRIKAVFGITN